MLTRLQLNSYRSLCHHQNRFVMFLLVKKYSSYLCKDNLNGLRSTSDNVTKQDNDLSGKNIQQQKFQTKALAFLAMVNESTLDSKQLEIHQTHVLALKEGEMFYQDPVTGYEVMTRLAHLQRGECCGSACRHCPYGQKEVPEELRRKYNSAFYG